MKVSENWLRTLVNPKVSTEKWIEQFTKAGIEVDSVASVGQENNEKVSDTVITLKVPPNRSDCLSMEGLAREWAAMNQIPFAALTFETKLPNTKATFPLSITAKKGCPCYVGRVLQNVNNKADSPSWLKERLEKAGIRSLSPVVDVMNYVMLELGQPMHAFDLASLNSEIVVRMAKKGEEIVTLEGKKLTLDENTLVIADKTKPIAIAGIMGGEETSVTQNSQNIFLESAYFDPINIRKTTQRFKLRTESSLRFERGIDSSLQVRAMERATELLLDIVGGNVGPLIEYACAENIAKPVTVILRSNRIKEILGISFENAMVEDLLRRLGMTFTTRKDRTTDATLWEVSIPSFRPDLNLEIDLIEELARLYGYENIPEILPKLELRGHSIPESQVALSKIKEILIALGYQEAITYSFISKELQKCLGSKEAPLVLSNPISQEMSIMRESLLPGLLQALQYNQARQNLRVRLFETGTVFVKKQEDWQEQSMLAGLVSGSLLKDQWGEKTRNVDFFDVKKDIETLLDLKNDQNDNNQGDQNRAIVFQAPRQDYPFLHPGQSAEIYLGSELLGYIGALHPALMKQFDFTGPVFLFELALQPLQTVKRPKFREMSKFPAIRRDIAVIVDEKVLAMELKSAIVNCIGSLLRDVFIFDVYQGRGIEPGRKSMAIGLLLQHPSRTLVEEEVNSLMTKVIEHLASRYHATLRE